MAEVWPYGPNGPAHYKSIDGASEKINNDFLGLPIPKINKKYTCAKQPTMPVWYKYLPCPITLFEIGKHSKT